MFAVGGKADVPATWPESLLLAKRRHSICRRSMVCRQLEEGFELGITDNVLREVKGSTLGHLSRSCDQRAIGKPSQSRSEADSFDAGICKLIDAKCCAWHFHDDIDGLADG